MISEKLGSVVIIFVVLFDFLVGVNVMLKKLLEGLVVIVKVDKVLIDGLFKEKLIVIFLVGWLFINICFEIVEVDGWGLLLYILFGLVFKIIVVLEGCW